MTSVLEDDDLRTGRKVLADELDGVEPDAAVAGAVEIEQRDFEPAE